jgi:alcohol dehydrogenase
MHSITLLQVPKLTVGPGCRTECRKFLSDRGVERAFLVATHSASGAAAALLAGVAQVQIDASIHNEPTVSDFNRVLAAARRFQPDVIIGLGGGSALDVAKLVAALLDGRQQIEEVFGIGLLKGRSPLLVCIPTTSGAGSEVSPNAILLDESDQMKKAVVSPWLVPDAAFVDAELTLTVPPAVTAATGLDALTHCIEAYTNRFAHPVVDTWALEGVRLIAHSLADAVQHPSDLEAREKMSLGSLYGGLCLGPVNTAAVHALSYPLGGWFHIAHGHANAILLPHVMGFNFPAATERYAAVAIAMGAKPGGSDEATAAEGARLLWSLIRSTGLEMRLSELGVKKSDIPRLASAGLGVTRLMKNNPRSMSQQEAEAIYEAALFAAAE